MDAGNSTLAETYQTLAENSKDESIEDVEKTFISHANMVKIRIITIKKRCLSY